MPTPSYPTSRAQAEADPQVLRAQERGFITIKKDRVTYDLGKKASYSFTDPEEWVRARVIADLVLERGYPPQRMRTEVKVPRRVPNDWADVVVYRDDKRKDPYLVVECKAPNQTKADRAQGTEQLFGNANSLRAPYGLYDEGTESVFFDVEGHPAEERDANRMGGRLVVPEHYGKAPEYAYVAGPGNQDIAPVPTPTLEAKIRRAHSLIWSGGKRDPLSAFVVWSMVLFAKVYDERNTKNGRPREFQVGTHETSATVATRVHELFERACKADRAIFPEGTRIDLPDNKIFAVVKVLQGVSITDTEVDSIGAAFEGFFGSVFRGELGQYFTMRPVARFVVAMLDISKDDYVIDPTAGSGGFLLEVLLQVWHALDRDYAGRDELSRYKNDFALHKVFGIEIHPDLARILKINLLLHHDGHTNVEGGRSCLAATYSKNRLSPFEGQFSRIVGNPPFGDKVEEGDEDLLEDNVLDAFTVADGRASVPSEHAVIERSVAMLEDGGRLGFVLPDGLFNNQGELSNCPTVRRFLAKNGVIEAIVSLPDYAFRRSGAQNKTSALFFRRFTAAERARFTEAYDGAPKGASEDDAIRAGLAALGYRVFLAEARYIGYTATGAMSDRNDLYSGGEGGQVDEEQVDTVLGEYRRFQANPGGYESRDAPDCMALGAAEMWAAHESHRLDPKYFLFKREEHGHTPDGWVRHRIGDVMERRMEEVAPESAPDDEVVVMTVAQTGDIRPREAGKGNAPPEWLGMYFEDRPSTWFQARAGDVVFSSIDLWKGCISVVPETFDGALVTKEFPIYRVTDDRLDAEFLSALLRSRYYQRAFRAITTGHSNRRRTQADDFEDLEIAFPTDRDAQRALIGEIVGARENQRAAAAQLKASMLQFSDLIDGRGDEEDPEEDMAQEETDGDGDD